MTVGSDGGVAFARSVLISNYQSPTGGYVYDLVRGQLSANATFTVTASDAMVTTLAPVYVEQFVCHGMSGAAAPVAFYEV